MGGRCGSSLMWVQARSLITVHHDLIIGNSNVFGQKFTGRSIHISRSTILLGIAWWIITCDINFIDNSIIISWVADIGCVPINFTTRPCNGSWSVGRITTWPNGNIHLGWGLWVLIFLGGGVISFVLVQGSTDDTIDGPCYIIFVPI